MRPSFLTILGIVLAQCRTSTEAFTVSHKRNSLDSALFGTTDDYETESKPRRRGRAPIRKATTSQAQAAAENRAALAQERHEQALQDPTLLTQSSFADRDELHPSIKRAVVSVLGLQKMTDVQLRTFAGALDGANVVGRARTGTGKTIAFLLPAVERILEMRLQDFSPGKDLGILVLAPSRELVLQIAKEATGLLSFEPNYNVMSMYGGTKMAGDINRLNKSVPSVLVTTPGRFLDHCENTKLRGRKFSDIVRNAKIVVLDEGDRLLEGFPKDMKRIMTYIPRAEKRQTMIFSATVPRRLRRVIDDILPSGYEEVDCIEGVKDETNERVSQSYGQLNSMDDYVTQLFAIVSKELKREGNTKLVVFFPAARLVKFFSLFFTEGLGIPVTAMHSRMSQSARKRTNEAFCAAKSGVLFTSDVSARGIDIPGVTCVVQYGAPSSRELYIHRLGRTGRAGRVGSGLLVFLPFESMKDIRKSEVSYVDLQEVDSSSAALLRQPRDMIQRGEEPLTKNANAAYLAFVAYYTANAPNLSKADVLAAGQSFADFIGLTKLPDLPDQLQ